MKTFEFRKVQGGWWGKTELAKTITVKAADEAEAWSKVRARADYHKRLRNGDWVTWQIENGDPR